MDFNQTDRRVLSYEEEMVIRYMHHDHGAMSIEAASRLMLTAPARIRRVLASAKRKAPQLFPILTEAQRKLLRFYETHDPKDWDRYELCFSDYPTDHQFLRKHNFIGPLARFDQYKPGMDQFVRVKY